MSASRCAEVRADGAVTECSCRGLRGRPEVNPFRETIVANPWDVARVDVPEIHGDVFEQCLRGIDHVRKSRHSAGLLIHGEAGSGKTHLLSRLCSHLTPREPTATHRPECLFV